jgi:hypothetical protein
MLELINEVVGVEVRVRGNETALPLAFVWRGQRYDIESWGRESSKMEGGRALHCHLVQTPGGDTWELCQDVEMARWTLVRHWAGRYRTV